ncbi:methyltransferase domain-containing protein [Agrococcus sp. SGAir0287]|uniref:methyltransferase domain-containing protein n=1 Tax=Agrococcus sp. SGAir0287 TaxID=2070347 RepID=UPI0010CD0F25|nr:methyltransferase domain-containing protein [Agrococcus sp. SGAir0287]QCR19072.1 SAM-dependent methyltransferase [Agrococcus sp. SGAir0287]
MSDVVYSHGHHESVTRAHAARTVQNSAAYLVPYLEPGQRILDVGCGPGSITIDLARRVGDGEVVGVDASAEVVAQARALAETSGVTNVRFEVGDAYALGAADGAFDVVHAHQVLQHLGDPVAALAEWRRVTCGIVAARDVVYSATTIHPASEALTEWRRIIVALQRANGGEADAGSHLKAWARAAGFASVATDVETWCFESDAARAWWGGQWAERALASSFASGTDAHGLATHEDRVAIADAWKAWAADPDGWMAMIHGWIVARG